MNLWYVDSDGYVSYLRLIYSLYEQFPSDFAISASLFFRAHIVLHLLKITIACSIPCEDLHMLFSPGLLTTRLVPRVYLFIHLEEIAYLYPTQLC